MSLVIPRRRGGGFAKLQVDCSTRAEIDQRWRCEKRETGSLNDPRFILQIVKILRETVLFIHAQKHGGRKLRLGSDARRDASQLKRTQAPSRAQAVTVTVTVTRDGCHAVENCA